MSDAIKYLTSTAFLGSIVTAVIAMVLLSLIKKFLIKKVAYTTKDEQHKNTFYGVIFNILQYVVVVVASIYIMQLNGVDVSHILTSLGIAGIIVGLALQDTLKDIISGINIYSNNFYKVGDLVRYNGEECDVKYFSARVTKFESILTHATYTVCNSQITSIEKIKELNTLNYYFDFDVEKDDINRCFDRVCERAYKECEHINTIWFDGISEINLTGVLYQLKLTCPAHKGEETRDQVAGITYEELKRDGVKPLHNTFYR